MIKWYTYKHINMKSWKRSRACNWFMAPNTHRMNHQHLHIQSCMSQQKVFCQTIAMSTKWRQLNVQAIKLIHYLWIMYRPVWQNDRRKIRHHCQIYASLLWCLSRPVWQAKDQASLPNSCQSSLMPQQACMTGKRSGIIAKFMPVFFDGQAYRRKIRHHCQIHASLLWCLSCFNAVGFWKLFNDPTSIHPTYPKD